MKGITIIVILSVVWSIIASIIEKKKAAAKKAASTSPSKQPTVQTGLKADPVRVKIESLRQRARASAVVPPPKVREVVPKPKKANALKEIIGLHDLDCPLPPSNEPLRSKNIPARKIAKMLTNRRDIRTAIVLNEILSKPVSQRI